MNDLGNAAQAFDQSVVMNPGLMRAGDTVGINVSMAGDDQADFAFSQFPE